MTNQDELAPSSAKDRHPALSGGKVPRAIDGHCATPIANGSVDLGLSQYSALMLATNENRCAPFRVSTGGLADPVGKCVERCSRTVSR